MVLDEASPSSGTFADDSSPTSDRDSYSQDGPASTSGVSSIEWNSLPKPMPFFGPLSGYTTANQASGIHAICRGHALALQRPLTSAEAQCIAYYYAKRDALASYGVPIGAATGMWRATRVHGTLKMPFYKFPEPQFSLKKFGPYTGARAGMMWRLAQKVMYTSMGAFFGKMLFVMYAVSVTVNGQRKDTRMKDIIDNTVAIGPREAMRRAEQGYVQGGGRAGGAAQGMSPQAGLDGYGGGGMGTESNTGVMSDQDSRNLEWQQQPDPNRSPAENNASTFQMDKIASQPAGFDFDDASPTAQRPQQQSGNAWERLRSGQGPPPQAQSRPQPNSSSRSPPPSSSETGGNAWARMRGDTGRSEQGSDSTNADGFSYSSTDEARQLAKAEAQREFDARVDRERQGKDFEEPGSGGKRWR